jgi:hypothetical protein
MALPTVAYERTPGIAAALPAPRPYRRREPERTALHAVVRDNLETLLGDARRRSEEGTGYPAFVEKEFRRYAGCGQLSGGFARLRCPACGHEQLVPFSCKGRVCPSCWSRRASDIAAWLVDEILPEAPYRQWVLTFPWELRFLLAMNPAFLTEMTGAFLRTLFAWQRGRGRRLCLGIRGGQTGSVTFVQRFGGVCNLNPHLHVLVPDGLFVPGVPDAPDAPDAPDVSDVPGQDPAAPLVFVPLPPPDDRDVRRLVVRVAMRLGKLATRRIEQAENQAEWQWPKSDDALLYGAALEALRMPRQPRLARRPDSDRDPDASDGHDGDEDRKSLCDSADGFSLHAARTVRADDRNGLEALCRYGLRAPFSNERLSIDPDGRVRLRLLRPWPKPDGRTDIVLEPLAFLRRLAVLIPQPYANLVRYHGVFANRSRFRPLLPKPPKPAAVAAKPVPPQAADANRLPPPSPPAADRPRRLDWAVLLRRVLDVDVLACPKCATPMLVLAFITDPAVVGRILRHLGIPTDTTTLAQARYPFDEPSAFSDNNADPPFEDRDCLDPANPSRAPP